MTGAYLVLFCTSCKVATGHRVNLVALSLVLMWLGSRWCRVIVDPDSWAGVWQLAPVADTCHSAVFVLWLVNSGWTPWDQPFCPL